MAQQNTSSTFIGFGAILLWALLALMTAESGTMPPFQLMACSFSIAFLIACLIWLRQRRSPLSAMRQPLKVWALGVGGLFGYHFSYFLALKSVPAAAVVEVSLIAYLWPLLIILFSALLPGEKLKWFHLAGGVMGFAGAAFIVTGGQGLNLSAEATTGYIAAGACALIWSGYSVANRLFPDVPTDAVGGFCAVTAALAVICHLALETTVWPDTTLQWIAVIGLGLGPVGGAFYLWDVGTKRGDIRLLGAASYLAPLLSTLVLTVTGRAEPTWAVGAACILITGGAVLAARDMFRRS